MIVLPGMEQTELHDKDGSDPIAESQGAISPVSQVQHEDRQVAERDKNPVDSMTESADGVLERALTEEDGALPHTCP